jgi:hypothetical protein
MFDVSLHIIISWLSFDSSRPFTCGSMHDSEPATRTNIIHALHFTSTPGDKNVLRALSKYINDEHYTVERAALDAAEKIGRF